VVVGNHAPCLGHAPGTAGRDVPAVPTRNMPRRRVLSVDGRNRRAIPNAPPAYGKKTRDGNTARAEECVDQTNRAAAVVSADGTAAWSRARRVLPGASGCTVFLAAPAGPALPAAEVDSMRHWRRIDAVRGARAVAVC